MACSDDVSRLWLATFKLCPVRAVAHDVPHPCGEMNMKIENNVVSSDVMMSKNSFQTSSHPAF